MKGLLKLNLKGFGPDEDGGTDSFTSLGSAGTAWCVGISEVKQVWG